MRKKSLKELLTSLKKNISLISYWDAEVVDGGTNFISGLFDTTGQPLETLEGSIKVKYDLYSIETVLRVVLKLYAVKSIDGDITDVTLCRCSHVEVHIGNKRTPIVFEYTPDLFTGVKMAIRIVNELRSVLNQSSLESEDGKVFREPKEEHQGMYRQ